MGTKRQASILDAITDVAGRHLIENRFWARVRKSDDCWEWTSGFDHFGYGRMHVKGSVVDVHRLSWALANGPIPEGMCICHKCDNPPCVNPSHLFLGTDADNIHDRDAKGRTQRGMRRTSAKLSDGDVIEIRRAYADGEGNQHELGRSFNVTQQTIWSVVHRVTWTHI